MPEWFDHWRFRQLRRLERAVGVERLYGLLHLPVAARSRWKTFFHPAEVGGLPPDLARRWDVSRANQFHLDQRLAGYVRFFQDRLHEPQWRERCEIQGLSILQSALAAERPVVLAFCHFGPFQLIRTWLWSVGIRAAMLRIPRQKDEPGFRRYLDQFMATEEASTVIYRDELRSAAEVLETKQPLLIAVDAPRGKLVEVPYAPGLKFRMATGAIRLAARREGTLIPCSIVSLGHWRYRIHLGEPVPRAVLSAKNPAGAAEHLLRHFRPMFEACPEQCGRAIGRAVIPE